MKLLPSHYTECEGGLWRDWPQEKAVSEADLAQRGFNKGGATSFVMIQGVRVHSLAIALKRWDCLNGWNNGVTPKLNSTNGCRIRQMEFEPETIAKVGKLVAYGFVDSEIADTLLITVEDVQGIRLLPEFRKAQASELEAKATQQILLSEGWDAIEERALEKVLQGLNYNTDPRFALAAAKIANSATRSHSHNGRKVLDAGRAGSTVVLHLGDKFIQNVQINGVPMDRKSIVDANGNPQIEKKVSDVVSPHRVMEILGIDDAKIDMAELEYGLKKALGTG